MKRDLTLELEVDDVLLRTKERDVHPILNHLCGWVVKVTKAGGRYIEVKPIDRLYQQGVAKLESSYPLPRELFKEGLWTVLRTATLLSVHIVRPTRFFGSSRRFHALSLDLIFQMGNNKVRIEINGLCGNLDKSSEERFLDEKSDRALRLGCLSNLINYLDFAPLWAALRKEIESTIPGQ